MKVHVIHSTDEGNNENVEGVVSKESVAKELCTRWGWWYNSYRLDDKYPTSLLEREKIRAGDNK